MINKEVIMNIKEYKKLLRKEGIMKKKYFIILMVLIGLCMAPFSPLFLVAEGKENGALEEAVPDVLLTTTVMVNLREALTNDDTGDNGNTEVFSFGDSMLQVSARLKGQTLFTVRTAMYSLCQCEHENSIDGNSVKIKQFIDRMDIQKIVEINGIPYAVIVGKRDLQLGLRGVAGMVPETRSRWRKLQWANWGVLALSVVIDASKSTDWFNKVELTIYEDGGGDFSVDDDRTGFFVRVEKNLMDDTIIMVSYDDRKNDHVDLNTGHRRTGIVGVHKRFNETTEGWIEAMILGNHVFNMLGQPLPKDTWGILVGAAYRPFEDKRWQVVAQISHIENVVEVESTLGVWVPMPLVSRLFGHEDSAKLGVQVRHTKHANDILAAARGERGGESQGQDETSLTFQVQIDLQRVDPYYN